MSRLHYLELSDNLLTGHIPPELGKLTNLFDLNVANNLLEGPIPDNLSSCTNLNSLNVHGNKLSGAIPPAFQKLESMTCLNLSSNNLKGSIPIELSRIGNLDTLDLSNNKISGYMPSSLGDLEHLLKFNLSRNDLAGLIPAEFGNLRSVMEIDLSNNHLSGPIPQELGQLQNLFLMKLENNNLSGDVMPLASCLSLTVLNVSYNNLTGHIPIKNNFSRFSPDSFFGNPGLCGSWLGPSCFRHHSAQRAILGISLGALVLLLMILITACQQHRSKPFIDGPLQKPPVNYTPTKLVILNMNMALHVYDDIMRMTENLSEKYVIGYGASSVVHTSSLLWEISCSLITWKMVAFGTFFMGLTRKRSFRGALRLNIALGAAQGLAYLHHDSSPRIIHRDVKSSNILLDKDYDAHLTDFGIAKNFCPSKTHTSTYVMGTIGYIDPEYARTSCLTEKSDVYSYGIVLLELLTGRKAVDNESNLHHLILTKAAENAVMDTVDPEIIESCKDIGEVKKVFQLALLCTKKQPSDRPTMHEVVRVLVTLVTSAPDTKMFGNKMDNGPLQSTTKVESYMNEYANLKTPHMVNCSTMSTSDADLFLKFGEVMAQNST